MKCDLQLSVFCMNLQMMLADSSVFQNSDLMSNVNWFYFLVVFSLVFCYGLCDRQIPVCFCSFGSTLPYHVVILY